MRPLGTATRIARTRSASSTARRWRALSATGLLISLRGMLGSLALVVNFWYTKSMKGARVSVHQKPKNKIGRPATGRDPAVTIRIPKDVLERVMRWAKKHNYNRSIAIVRLIERGLRSADEP